MLGNISMCVYYNSIIVSNIRKTGIINVDFYDLQPGALHLKYYYTDVKVSARRYKK